MIIFVGYIKILNLNLSVNGFIIFLIIIAVCLLFFYFIFLFIWSRSKKVVQQKQELLKNIKNNEIKKQIINFEKEISLVTKKLSKK